MGKVRIVRAVRRVAESIHLVDKCLMIFLAVLLIQSAFSLFFPGEAGEAEGDIDIIVRTSSAAIFGYFLSANFNRRPRPSCTEAELAGEDEEQPGPVPREQPRAKIGFQPGEEGERALRTAPPELRAPAGGTGETCRLQVVTAWIIGMFCLLILLLLRWAGLPADSSAAATVAQFRDFVSGCVGFLIGCPTRKSEQTQP